MTVVNKSFLGKLVELLGVYMQISKFYGSKFKDVVKVEVDDGGYLNFIMFNGDLKMRCRCDIPNFNSDMVGYKYYNISVLYKVLSNLSVYNYVSYNVKNNIFEYEDGKVGVVELGDLDEIDIIKNGFCVVDDVKVYDREVNDLILNNINKLIDVFKLRNTKYRNNYYYKDGKYYFDFFDVYCYMDFNSVFDVRIDLYSLKLIYKILKLYSYKQFSLISNNDKVKFSNDDVYIEFNAIGNVFGDDDVRLKLLENIGSYNSNEKIIISSSILNFIKMVERSDIDVSLCFDKESKMFLAENDMIRSSFSNIIYVDNNVNDFSIKGSTLKRILSFIKDKDIDRYEFSYIDMNGERYLKIVDKNNISIYLSLL